MIPSYVQSYQTRAWKTHKMLLVDRSQWPTRASVPQEEVYCLNSEGGKAKEIGECPNRFYIDWELVAAGMEPTWGTFLHRLEEDWRNHKAGALILRVCDGINKEPPFFTFAVEA